jgi:hypothetical protein
MANEHAPLNPAKTRNSFFCNLSFPTALSSGVAFAATFGHFLLSSKVEPNIAATVLLGIGIATSGVAFALSSSKVITDCCKRR